MNIPHVPEAVEFHRKRIERLRKTEDLPAPWDVYPEIPCGSIEWRMGPGEDVFGDWLTWLRALAPEQRASYRGRHPEPASWSELCARQFERLNQNPSNLNWDEFWNAEFQRLNKMWGPKE